MDATTIINTAILKALNTKSLKNQAPAVRQALALAGRIRAGNQITPDLEREAERALRRLGSLSLQVRDNQYWQVRKGILRAAMSVLEAVLDPASDWLEIAQEHLEDCGVEVR